ncbi:MAG: TlpA family protein disulfide reductase [Bacteroidota bacterium]|nr:TlpA family protein disulfide reductase [Bacteroidota bacterium]
MRMMRTILPISILLSLLASCGQGIDKGGSKIELRITGGEGKVAYFDRFENNKPFHVDSVKLGNDGTGTIGLAPLPLDFYRITVGDSQVIVALDSTENLSFHAAIDSLDRPQKIEGSEHTRQLIHLQADQRTFENERNELRQKLAAEPGNAETIGRFNQLNAEHYERTKQFVNENSGTPAALNAISRLDLEKEFPLYQKVRDDLRKAMPRSPFFTQFRQRVDQYEQQMLAMKMQEEEMKRLGNLLPIGGEAPEIRQQTPDGGTFALSEMRGKVVLIDFWASWCRPCRIENPAVKKVYAKYKDKGFDILGVSLDKAQEAWVGAIQQDGLPWKHVSDLGFWQNAAAQEYGVQSIPFTVLVDRDGKILEKGLRAHDLEARLAQIFGS